MTSGITSFLSTDSEYDIFRHLPMRDVAACSQTCKRWHQITSGPLYRPLLWKSLFKRDFPSYYELSRVGNYPDAYKYRHLLNSNLSKGVFSLQTLSGVFRGVLSLILPNGDLIAGSNRNKIIIRDLRTGDCKTTLNGHGDTILCFAFTNQMLISGAQDLTIRFWDLQSKQCIKTLTGHTRGISSLAFTDKELISSSFDLTIKIWDMGTGSCLQTLVGHTDSVNSLVFVNGKLISGSNDRTIKIWDWETKTCIQTLTGHRNYVLCLVFGEGKLYSGSIDSTIKVWDIDEGRCLHTLVGHNHAIRNLIIAERKLFSGSFDNTIKIWDIDNNVCLKTLKGHTHIVSSLTFAEGKLISGDFDENMRIWDFNAMHHAVFEEIAEQLENGSSYPGEQILERFSGMPASAKNAIFQELYDSLKPFPVDYLGCGEDAFYNQNAQFSTGPQKAQAIRSYLAKQTKPTTCIETIQKTLKLQVKCNTGYGNSLVLCGSGGDLSWDPTQAKPLVCEGKRKWTIALAPEAKEFKLLLKTKDDCYLWERGANRTVNLTKSLAIKKIVF